MTPQSQFLTEELLCEQSVLSELGGSFFTCPVLINLYGSTVVQPYK